MIKSARHISALKKWHSRVGLTVALMLVMLSITGILINHSSGLQLEQNTLPGWLAKLSYNIQPAPYEVITGDRFKIITYEKRLSINASSTSRAVMLHGADDNTQECTGGLRGLANLNNELWIACEKEISIYLLNAESPVFVEQLDGFSGLPTDISEFGSCSRSVCLISPESSYMYSSENLTWVELTQATEIETGLADIKSEQAMLVPPEITWYRWLLDLHAGRIFGNIGVWLVDLTGVAVLVLVATGFLRWKSTRKSP